MLLSVSHLSKSYGVDVVLSDVSFRIDRREKVAVVGRNGEGKTTLVKILTGEIEADSGSVQLARGAKVGDLRQEHPVTPGLTVLQEAERARADVIQLRSRLDELELALEAGATGEELEEYAALQEHFHELEGFSAERDVRSVLLRVGFEEHEFEKQTTSLSGGEKTRLALARLLLEEPDLLILDEPTNHLDLQATEWLEGWIARYPGAVLLVSHDRTFLEATAQRTIEIREGEAKSYPGGFAKYLEIRASDEAWQAELAKRQSQEAAKLDEYVRRFMNSQRTAQARGRLKKLEKLLSTKVEAPQQSRSMAAGFAKAHRSADVVASFENATIGYGGVPLVSDANWTVRWRERWGVVGENGAGKSTLVKALMGRVSPISGTVRLGSNVVAGYFAQDVVDLDEDDSPLDYLVYSCGMEPQPARDLLGRFLFSGDQVQRPIGTLSGGEKNKLVLASLVQLKPNLLILDEPTNHLDMDSREALAAVLSQFSGSLILVSHDRWLIEQATELTLDVRRGRVETYMGRYSEYRSRQTGRALADHRARVKDQTPALSARELSKEIIRQKKVVEGAASDVEKAESKLRDIEKRLANPTAETDVWKLSMEHSAAQGRLEELFAKWGEESARLDEYEARQGRAE